MTLTESTLQAEPSQIDVRIQEVFYHKLTIPNVTSPQETTIARTVFFPAALSNTLAAPELSPVVLVDGALEVPETEEADPDEADDEETVDEAEDDDAVGGGEGNERDTLGEAMLQNCWESVSALFKSVGHSEEMQETMDVVKRVMLDVWKSCTFGWVRKGTAERERQWYVLGAETLHVNQTATSCLGYCHPQTVRHYKEKERSNLTRQTTEAGSKYVPQGEYPLKLGKFALLVALADELAFVLPDPLLEAEDGTDADPDLETLAEVVVSLGADTGGGVNACPIVNAIGQTRSISGIGSENILASILF